MSRCYTSFAVAAAVLCLGATTVQAQTITPAGTFGSLPANSFGGSGIPTNAVMLGGANGATIGLSATQRYASPAPTNDGAGTYYAQAGISSGAPGGANAGFSTWNFDYFVGNPSQTDVFTLYVDFNPAMGSGLTDPMTHKYVLGVFPGYSDSSNLGYGLWQLPNATFDPNAAGEYSFALYQKDLAGNELSHVAMNVNVTTTPEPSSLALLGSGIVGLAGFVKRRIKLV